MSAAKKSNLIVGLVVMIAGLIVNSATLQMPSGPAGFPRLIATVMTVCGILLIVQHVTLLRGGSDQNIDLGSEYNYKFSILTACAWICLIAAAHKWGFLVTVYIFLAGLAWILHGRPREKSAILALLGFAFWMSIALWLVFGTLLGVEPPGPFPF